MDRIAYHPIRVCQHASLFLPLSEQELKIYQTESVNTLRQYPPTDRSLRLNGTHPSDLPHSNTAANHQLPPPCHPASDTGSPPVGYSTPSPLPIPLGSLPAEHRPNLPSNKRPLQTTQDHPQDPNSFQLNMTHPPAMGRQGPNDYANKRSRHDPSPRHVASSDTQNSISEEVAQHYNMRPNLTKGARTESPIFSLRKFNNWIKSVTIGKFASVESSFMAPLLSTHHQRQPQPNHHSNPNPKSITGGTKILELGCGKGGDLAKWQNAGVRELYGFGLVLSALFFTHHLTYALPLHSDIARISIEQAQARYQQSCSQRFYAKFIALDCFSVSHLDILPIDSVLSPEELREPFQAVSLQFCMHYAFESEAKARTMMENVSKYLVTGGVMIGTIPDPDLLLNEWERCSHESNEDQPSFGNSVYQIRFPYPLTSREQLDQVYGHRYSFYLQDAVEDVPEYFVLWEPFVRCSMASNWCIRKDSTRYFSKRRPTPRTRICCLE
ncbi:mRNA cap guanine-N7 methyltransferase [Puccinia sorghi]|uniref:mRNA cap guanine-N(7) methyltransferase n=1 Tax=Puccinia sorghi TaxID=27349 RepID=A0A0L6UZ04_9BASI|nr:mRNA cap guanine-N7 methyltransferase [Puccinia sorghi]